MNVTDARATGSPARSWTHGGLSCELIAVHAREADVEERDIEGAFIRNAQGRDAIAGDRDDVARRFEDLAQHLGSVFVVIDDQDPQLRFGGRGVSAGQGVE